MKIQKNKLKQDIIYLVECDHLKNEYADANKIKVV